MIRFLTLPLLLVVGAATALPTTSVPAAARDIDEQQGRAKVIAPMLSWQREATLSVDALGGIPVGTPSVALGSDSRPWLFALVNPGIGQDYVVKVVPRDESGWQSPVTLGNAYTAQPEWILSGIFPSWAMAASSPSGAAVMWRSAEDQLTLAVERPSRWVLTTVDLPSGVLGRVSSTAWVPLWRWKGNSMLTLRWGQQLMAWRFADESGKTTMLSAAIPAASDGKAIQDFNQQLWFDGDERLHFTYAEVPENQPTGPVTLIDRVLDESANTWGTAKEVSRDIVGMGGLRNVLVDGVSGLLWSATDRRFGVDPQVEGAWQGSTGWSSMPSIESVGMITPPSLGSVGGGCLYTTDGFKLIKPYSAPVSLRLGREAPRILRPLEAFRMQNSFCVIATPYAPAASETWATQLNGFGSLIDSAGVASTDTAFLVANQERAIRTYAMKIMNPAAPGPVRDLRVVVKKKGANRVVLQVEWSASDAIAYPAASYRFRWASGKNWQRWIDTGSTQKTTITTSPGLTVRFQVQAVNSLGASKIVTLTYRT